MPEETRKPIVAVVGTSWENCGSRIRRIYNSLHMKYKRELNLSLVECVEDGWKKIEAAADCEQEFEKFNRSIAGLADFVIYVSHEIKDINKAFDLYDHIPFITVFREDKASRIYRFVESKLDEINDDSSYVIKYTTLY